MARHARRHAFQSSNLLNTTGACDRKLKIVAFTRVPALGYKALHKASHIGSKERYMIM